jgi:hypothetical protein
MGQTSGTPVFGQQLKCEEAFASRSTVDRCLDSAKEPSGAPPAEEVRIDDGICDYANFGTQSLAPDTCRFREESHSAVIRDLVKAHPIQSRRRAQAFCARPIAGIPAHRR